MIRLPFTSDQLRVFTDSKVIALNQFLHLEKRLHRNSTYLNEYVDFLHAYETLGHMKPLAEFTSDNTGYYIPHHAVLREDSITSHLRVVFNASQKSTSGESLNNYLLPGPKLQTDLSSIILRWRQFAYVMIADIEKMYCQILVHPNDTKYQKILWRVHPSELIRAYELLTVTYGTTSAPYLAIRVLQQLAADEGHRYPFALPILAHQTYVDDCLIGAHDLSTAHETKKQLIGLLASGGFNLRKWASNCHDLLNDIDPSNHGLAVKVFDSSENLKILGITWNRLIHSILKFQLLVLVSPLRDFFYQPPRDSSTR